MKLAISNLAWQADNHHEVMKTLLSLGVAGLEVAPGLLFADYSYQDYFAFSKEKLHQHVDSYRQGLPIISMQSVLYGVENIALFGTDSERKNLVLHLEKMLQLASELSIPTIVFGSPKQRVIPEEMSVEQATEIALEVFTQIGDIAHKQGVSIALEPLPKELGSDFLQSVASTVTFLEKLQHPGVGINFDTATQIINQANVAENYTLSKKHIRHVHLSEPFLKKVPQHTEFHKQASGVLNQDKYSDWISIEMVQQQPHLADAVQSIKKIYEV